MAPEDTSQFWNWKPKPYRPRQARTLDALLKMTLDELQKEVVSLGVRTKCNDKEHLIHILTAYREIFLDHCARLRGRSVRSLRWMTPELEVSIDIFYPYSKREMVELIAEKLAVDYVKSHSEDDAVKQDRKIEPLVT